MATPKQVTEPAKPVSQVTVTEPAVPERDFDPRNMVYVYEVESGQKLDNPVPETFLDGRFPQLREVPSSKKGQ